MTLVVDVDYATKAPWAPSRARLAAWAHAAAGRQARRGAELAIRVVGPRESRRLNREWRGKDKPTNVLSFPGATVAGTITGDRSGVRATGRASATRIASVEFAHLGDLVICASVVAREAREQKKTLSAHWAHMVVHGTLHLLGFDHESDADANRMEGREKRVLARLGFTDPYRSTGTGT